MQIWEAHKPDALFTWFRTNCGQLSLAAGGILQAAPVEIEEPKMDVNTRAYQVWVSEIMLQQTQVHRWTCSPLPPSAQYHSLLADIPNVYLYWTRFDDV